MDNAIMTRDIKIYIAIIVLLLNCYFVIGLSIGYIQNYYVSLFMYFNVLCLTFFVMNLFLRLHYSIQNIRRISSLVLISTLISLLLCVFNIKISIRHLNF